MRIVEVNYTDLPGRAFNGYDLHQTLLDQGLNVSMIVREKISDTVTVEQIPSDRVQDVITREIEDRHGVQNMLIPYGAGLERMSSFKKADVVHFHILHNRALSVYDYPRIMNQKKSVWTIHDPWATTGGCIHPLSCSNYLSGCHGCEIVCNADFLWEQKKKIFAKINPYIVVSTKWMLHKIQESPLTEHFNKLSVIPFGVNVEDYSLGDRTFVRTSMGMSKDTIAIGFRVTDNELKGVKYIFKALEGVVTDKDIALLSVDNGVIPEKISKKYKCITFGWTNDKQKLRNFFLACDIFIMPSLAESFGVMAIEAMAAETVVMCFKDTVVEEIIDAPNIGIAAKYMSAESLMEEVMRLLANPEGMVERKKRGRERVKRHYSFSDYIQRHKDLYESVQSETGFER